jgi:hypothetical protein
MHTYSADFSSYRGFKFGASVATSAKQAGVDVSRASVLHSRPAKLVEVDWDPQSSYPVDRRKLGPVRDAKLRFYNDQLFQIIVTYERTQIAGLSEKDMIESISRTYGEATKPAEEIPFHSNYSDTAQVLARWENGDYSSDLVRTGDQNSFALVLSSAPLDKLARAAILEAARLDALEAPEREAKSRREAAEDSRLSLDQARSVNLPNFIP